MLLMTPSANDDVVVAPMRGGARGYVVKGAGRNGATPCQQLTSREVELST